MLATVKRVMSLHMIILAVVGLLFSSLSAGCGSGLMFTGRVNELFESRSGDEVEGTRRDRALGRRIMPRFSRRPPVYLSEDPSGGRDHERLPTADDTWWFVIRGRW